MSVGPPNSRTEMYAGRVPYCPLVRDAQNALHALLRLEERQDRQTDRRQTKTLRFFARRGQRYKVFQVSIFQFAM